MVILQANYMSNHSIDKDVLNLPLEGEILYGVRIQGFTGNNLCFEDL